jgi:hypothetical protein
MVADKTNPGVMTLENLIGLLLVERIPGVAG